MIDELCIRSPESLAVLRDDGNAMARTLDAEGPWLDTRRTLALVTETVVNIA